MVRLWELFWPARKPISVSYYHHRCKSQTSTQDLRMVLLFSEFCMPLMVRTMTSSQSDEIYGGWYVYFGNCQRFLQFVPWIAACLVLLWYHLLIVSFSWPPQLCAVPEMLKFFTLAIHCSAGESIGLASPGQIGSCGFYSSLSKAVYLV